MRAHIEQRLSILEEGYSVTSTQMERQAGESKTLNGEVKRQADELQSLNGEVKHISREITWTKWAVPCGFSFLGILFTGFSLLSLLH